MGLADKGNGQLPLLILAGIPEYGAYRFVVRLTWCQDIPDIARLAWFLLWHFTLTPSFYLYSTVILSTKFGLNDNEKTR
jgi:hypothetical protein